MVTSVHLALLGRFEVRVDGATVRAEDFERRSGAELVQLLALARGHRLHREQVMEALWPGAASRSAANSLRKAATFARNATGAADAIVIRDQVVALFPDREVEVDVDTVEAARADDEDSVAAALQAYRGELLPDTPYAEWAIQDRDRLQRHLSGLLAAARRWDDLLALDPANEEAVVAVMDRALAARDRLTVLRHYDDLETRLRNELGVTPSQAAIVLRDRALDLDGPAAGPTTGMWTFLIADVEGSPGPGATVDDPLVDEAVRREGGTVFEQTGDDVKAVFGSASAAVAAAVAIQRTWHAAVLVSASGWRSVRRSTGTVCGPAPCSTGPPASSTRQTGVRSCARSSSPASPDPVSGRTSPRSTSASSAYPSRPQRGSTGSIPTASDDRPGCGPPGCLGIRSARPATCCSAVTASWARFGGW